MTSPNETHIPKLVRDALQIEGAYDLGLGVVLRAPTDPDGTGASASYRIDYRVEPVIPGRPLSRRKQAYSRSLRKAYAKAEAKLTEMKERAAGTYVEYATDVAFGEVVEHWYGSPHPRWGANYPSKVRSLLDCWVLDAAVTIRRPRGTVPIADVPVGALTANDYNQALEHVRARRSYRTYTDVHGLVVQIIKWAVANRFLRPTDLTITQQMPLAVSDQHEATSTGRARAVPEEEIPPPEMIDALAATAEELFGPRLRTQIYLLAYTGIRVSESLALPNDDRFVLDGQDGCWRIHIREQVHKSTRRILPPKWRKTRWAFVPEWLTDEVSELLRRTEPGQPLFPSPGRKVRGDDGQLRRVDRGLHPYDHWRPRRWDPIAEATPGWPERDDWWPPQGGSAPEGTQSQRRWQWSAHSLRHAAATYQLNVLGLDCDDVAKFLGHRSGVQVWEMYVRVRPQLFGRAADASRQAGDPRTRPET